MSGLNLKSLGKKLIEELGLVKDDEEMEPLKQKIEKGGITSNDDIGKSIDFLSKSAHHSGELSIINRMRGGESVGTFVPLKCSICQQPMRGALIEPGSEIGRKIIQAIGIGAVHDVCNRDPASNSKSLPVIRLCLLAD